MNGISVHLRISREQGMVALWRREDLCESGEGLWESEASLVYTVNSRLAGATGNPGSKIKY